MLPLGVAQASQPSCVGGAWYVDLVVPARGGSAPALGPARNTATCWAMAFLSSWRMDALIKADLRLSRSCARRRGSQNLEGAPPFARKNHGKEGGTLAKHGLDVGHAGPSIVVLLVRVPH